MLLAFFPPSNVNKNDSFDIFPKDYIPNISLTELKILNNTPDKELVADNINLNSTNYFFLVNFIFSMQNISYLKSDIVYMLSLYRLLMPAALQQPLQGRKLLQNTLFQYYQSHEARQIHNSQCLSSHDGFYFCVMKWLSYLKKDFFKEYLELCDHPVFYDMYYKSATPHLTFLKNFSFKDDHFFPHLMTSMDYLNWIDKVDHPRFKSPLEPSAIWFGVTLISELSLFPPEVTEILFLKIKEYFEYIVFTYAINEKNGQRESFCILLNKVLVTMEKVEWINQHKEFIEELKDILKKL